MKKLIFVALLTLIAAQIGRPLELRASFESLPVSQGDQTGGDTPQIAFPKAMANEPEATDERFVKGSGEDLDRYLFRPDVLNGRLTFNIPITRYYFNENDKRVEFEDGFLTEEAVDHLVSKRILPPTAHLWLRVYDVDEDAQPCGEVDHIYVNGEQVLQNGSAAKLSGANNTWSTPSFQIPIGNLKFPQVKGVNGSPPPPTDNKIEIDIDVEECGGPGRPHWAVAVDWGMIEIPNGIRPIVFAHGWTADTNTFNKMEKSLTEDAIPSAGQVDLREGLQPIVLTGSILKSAIELKIVEFGVDKVNIFAHSKGGLVTRQALIFKETAAQVENVVTFASPHHGSTMAADFFVEVKCSFQYSGDEAKKELCISSGQELTKARMQEFNYSGCRWNWILGDWWRCEPRATAIKQGTIAYYSFAAEGDEAVKPLESTTFPWEADAKPFPEEINVDAIFNPGSLIFDHSAILEERNAYRCAIAKIAPTIYRASAVCPSNKLDTRPDQQVVNTTGAMETVLIKREQIASGDTQMTRVIIDSGSQAVFRVDSDAALSVTLLTPAAKVIDPATATSDPNVTFASSQSEGGWVYEYVITNPPEGDWEVVVSASGTADYAVFAQNRSPVTLITLNEKGTYQPGEILTLEAALADESSLIGAASLIAELTYPDGTTNQMSLLDNGSGGDTAAGDQIFTGQIGVGSEKGFLTILLRAERSNLTRMEQLLVGVAPQTATIKQANSAARVDTNGNGLYDLLNFNLTLNVLTPGHFDVEAVLKTAGGEIVGASGYSSFSQSPNELGVGDHVVVLQFNGEQIRSFGEDGPYTLTNVFVKDTTDGSFEIDAGEDLFTTPAYSVAQFERPLIIAAGFADNLVDSDGNGRSDSLDISFEVDVVYPGTYEINGRLVDPFGNEIGWAKTSFFAISAGTYSEQLNFEGISIVNHGVNGPYTLQDVSLFNTGGQASEILYRPHTTKPYQIVNFEGGVARIYMPAIVNP